jgi:hypothetical protein
MDIACDTRTISIYINAGSDLFINNLVIPLIHLILRQFLVLWCLPDVSSLLYQDCITGVLTLLLGAIRS